MEGQKNVDTRFIFKTIKLNCVNSGGIISVYKSTTSCLQPFLSQPMIQTFGRILVDTGHFCLHLLQHVAFLKQIL